MIIAGAERLSKVSVNPPPAATVWIPVPLLVLPRVISPTVMFWSRLMVWLFAPPPLPTLAKSPAPFGNVGENVEFQLFPLVTSPLRVLLFQEKLPAIPRDQL